MRRMLPIVLLFGGLIIFSGVLDKAFSTPSANAIANNKLDSAIIIESKPNVAAPSSADVVNADLIQVELVQTREPQLKPVKKGLLENVNGISLSDDLKTVIEKIGQPLSKAKDPFLSEMEVYTYPTMNIAFSDGVVSYVEILVTAGIVNIDNIPVKISEAGLKQALGEPDFVADDGIVFQRDQAFVKLFTDMDSHEVTAIHYYYHPNI